MPCAAPASQSWGWEHHLHPAHRLSAVPLELVAPPLLPQRLAFRQRFQTLRPASRPARHPPSPWPVPLHQAGLRPRTPPVRTAPLAAALQVPALVRVAPAQRAVHGLACAAQWERPAPVHQARCHPPHPAAQAVHSPARQVQVQVQVLEPVRAQGAVPLRAAQAAGRGCFPPKESPVVALCRAGSCWCQAGQMSGWTVRRRGLRR